MDELYAEQLSEFEKITKKYMDILKEMWVKMFDIDLCRDHFVKWSLRFTNIFNEVVAESKILKEELLEEIAELKDEGDHLKNLLKLDIKISINEDLPLTVQQRELENSLEELREQVRVRKEQVQQLLREQELFCEQLGESPRPLFEEPLPSEEDIHAFKQHLNNLKEEQNIRQIKLLVMRNEIRSFLQTLELHLTGEAEDYYLNHEDIKLDNDTFMALTEMHERYKSQVQELKEKIEELKENLEPLWNRLETSPKTREKFKRYTDYSQLTFDKFYAEYNRCQILKRQNMGKFIEKMREEINDFWNKTLISEEQQRNRLSCIDTNKCYTEELLMLCEKELQEVKLHYERNKEIFQLYEQRQTLWHRMNALEAKSLEPSRFTNRGGQLLQEEKERKIISNKLPKIEHQIIELVKEYEEREQKPFLAYGRRICDVIDEDWEAKRRDKELNSSARKKAQIITRVPPVSPNPMRNKKLLSAELKKSTSTIEDTKRKRLCSPEEIGSNENLTPAKSPMNLELPETNRSPSPKMSASYSRCASPSNLPILF